MKKRLFTDFAAPAAEFDYEKIAGEGDTVYEILSMRKFKAKFDENAKLILPKEKKQ